MNILDIFDKLTGFGHDSVVSCSVDLFTMFYILRWLM